MAFANGEKPPRSPVDSVDLGDPRHQGVPIHQSPSDGLGGVLSGPFRPFEGVIVSDLQTSEGSELRALAVGQVAVNPGVGKLMENPPLVDSAHVEAVAGSVE